MTTIKPEKPIRVVIADDHAIIRDGLRAVLAVAPDIDLVGEATNGVEAVAVTASQQPDVMVIDLVMPGMDGIEAIDQITRENPQTRILVLTTFAGEDRIFPALKAGALGYQLKDSKSEDLLRAIREVYRGESSLHPKIARKVLQELKKPAQTTPTTDPLTPREVEVLKLIAAGAENADIAAQLVISEATVRSHLSHILDKLHLANRTQAALYALREGIASLDEGGAED